MDVEVVAMDPCRGPGTPGPKNPGGTQGGPGATGKIEGNALLLMGYDCDVLGISWDMGIKTKFSTNERKIHGNSSQDPVRHTIKVTWNTAAI